ncbi:MAG: hypothetical protein P1U46_02455 [Patescibacteria group bacterium]|nr:hypothetical protein [Patescibacteria group bacterium]
MKELISKSKKTPLSIPEIQYLLKEENLIFIPLEIKEGLQNKIREKIVEKSRNLDDIFLNKDKIGDYIKNNGSNFLLDYIKYLT